MEGLCLDTTQEVVVVGIWLRSNFQQQKQILGGCFMAVNKGSSIFSFFCWCNPINLDEYKASVQEVKNVQDMKNNYDDDGSINAMENELKHYKTKISVIEAAISSFKVMVIMSLELWLPFF